MRIIAINRFYRPDHSATSQLLGDLAEQLSSRGYDVVVLTSRLQYEGGESLSAREQINGVDVQRLATTSFGRSNLLGRAVDYLTFYLAAFWTLLLIGRRGDTLIIKTDPPMLCAPAGLAARLKGMRTINWCQDLFPEVAGALGLGWARGWIGAVLRSARNRALRRAAFNAVLHARMAERLEAQKIPADRIRVLPNWADAGIRPVAPAANALRRDWGFDQATLVIGYSGNLGRAHMPEAVADLVRRTQDIPGLAWLFIGGGKGIDTVREAAFGARNVVFKPYQPREQLSLSLSTADIHLITLDPDCEGYIVPSKYAGVRAADRPVLFMGAADGAIAQEVAREGRGAVLAPASPDLWRAQVEALLKAVGASHGHPAAPSQAGDDIARWIQAIGSVSVASRRSMRPASAVVRP